MAHSRFGSGVTAGGGGGMNVLACTFVGVAVGVRAVAGGLAAPGNKACAAASAGRRREPNTANRMVTE